MGQHRAVSPNVEIDPAVLRAAAATVDALLPALPVPDLDPGDLDALARAAAGAALVTEHDRLTTAGARAGLDLAELVAGLRAVADGIESADHDVVLAIRGVDR